MSCGIISGAAAGLCEAAVTHVDGFKLWRATVAEVDGWAYCPTLSVLGQKVPDPDGVIPSGQTVSTPVYLGGLY